MSGWLTVARKEIRDHARDRRSLASAAAYALMGPAVVWIVSQSRAAEGARGPQLLVSMASVFALVSAFAGGMNLAMDSTAGERERRSLVPLLLNPVSRWDLVIGKWLAAIVFGAGAVALTVVAFFAVLASGARVPEGLAAPAARWVGFGLCPLVLLGSALHLLVSTRSRTTKEAHGWLSMLVLVPMIVGMFTVFSPASIDRWWFVAPIAGAQSLIARGLDGRPVGIVEELILAAVTIALSVPALHATRVALDRDDVLVR